MRAPTKPAVRRPLGWCLLGHLLVPLAFSNVALAGNVSAQPANSTVTVTTSAATATAAPTTIATVSYQVQVFNYETVPIKGVMVSDPSGAVLTVGDIAPGGQGVSPPSSVRADITQYPSQTLAMPITLHYIVNGQQVDLQWQLGFFLPR